MGPRTALYPRQAQRCIDAALGDTRVVVLTGARQTGKSTLARLIAADRPGTAVRYLDEAVEREAATADPASFVRHDGLLVIDEVQRVPDLMLAVKHVVDLDPRPGRFLLTGSARLFGLSEIPDLLPGRTETIELWPLSQGEVDGVDETFIDRLFDPQQPFPPPDSLLRRDDYVHRALRGGYPGALLRADPGRRSRFFESYISDLVNRDIRQLSDIERPADMRRLLAALAARMSSPMAWRNVAGDLQIPATTLRRYLDLLELVHVVRRVPAWSTNLTTRATATPKLIMIDSGLAGHLTGLTARRAAHPHAPVGQLVENFVTGELARQLTWATEPVRQYHYRDRDRYEVDIILEHASGDIAAIEVKASETVRSEDFRGIDRLARHIGDRLVHGLVLYAGQRALSFGDNRRAWPISTLWAP